jgi:mannitol/fructose-specific phosphotransferase system IIA component (Ntr-type)
LLHVPEAPVNRDLCPRLGTRTDRWRERSRRPFPAGISPIAVGDPPPRSSVTAQAKEEAITVLAHAVALAHGLEPRRVAAAVLERERAMSTGLERGSAVPHARLEELAAPLVGLGLCHRGVDFDTVDGTPCRFIVLILAPVQEDLIQLEILADVARTLGSEAVQHQTLCARSFAEVRAALLTAEPRHGEPRLSGADAGGAR